MNNLTGQFIRHVSSITHDAKTIVTKTAPARLTMLVKRVTGTRHGPTSENAQ